MRNVNCSILSGADTGNVTGSAIDANQLLSGSFVINFGDATANGTVYIQASNDVPTAYGLPFTPTNWGNIPNASYATAAGVTGVIFLPQMAFRWIRAIYVRAGGGSTTVSVNMNALGI